MSNTDFLKMRLPGLAGKLPRMPLASLPTPVHGLDIEIASSVRRIFIKSDNLTGRLYGGNKLRKLEYIFPLARKKGCRRIATFGAVGSNHALATALYAKLASFECTCFLSHQAKTALVPATLNMHLKNRTQLVRYGGAFKNRINTLRRYLWGRNVWVIPMGGSSWLGTIGFVAAGLELAAQIRNQELPCPDRLYVGTGTMGTAVGLALGLALADLDIEIHGVRVSDLSIANEGALQSLLQKTLIMMRRLDDSIPADLISRTKIKMRHDFFGPGYARSTPATDAAINFARRHLNMTLESTYTGKTLAAMLADLQDPRTAQKTFLYWHTYNSAPLDVPTNSPLDEKSIPAEFRRYF